MARYLPFLFASILYSCSNGETSQSTNNPNSSATAVSWHTVDTIDLKSFNADLEVGKPTMDVGIYFPSNFDSAFDKVTLKQMMISLRHAKGIYKPTGVQINLLWVKTGKLDPKYFSIQANEVPGIPETEYANMYIHSKRHPAQLTNHALDAFSCIIEPDRQNNRTIYLVALQDVFYPFMEVSEGRNWTVKSVRTGGLSFPTYSYCNTIPKNLRGIITITNLSRPDRLKSTIAHELGHKVINVSHEYKATHPGHEIFADGGLMLYGDGIDIPSGPEGRWHLERLHKSPFLYVTQSDGSKKWNQDYKEGGHYYDPIYGEYVVRFPAAAQIDQNW